MNMEKQYICVNRVESKEALPPTSFHETLIAAAPNNIYTPQNTVALAIFIKTLLSLGRNGMGVLLNCNNMKPKIAEKPKNRRAGGQFSWPRFLFFKKVFGEVINATRSII